MQLRDYQETAVAYAVEWANKAGSGDRLLLASPTGTGKSFMQLACLERLPESILVTPRLEIIIGLLNKAGVDTSGISQDGILSLAAARRIYTPIRLRTLLLSGTYHGPRSHLLMDEAHHDSSESWQDLHLLCGYPPAIGFTATPFRGTPRGTAEFRQLWGEPVWVITFAEAVAEGALALPSCRTVPLLDDDEIEIANGELVAKQVNAAVASRLEAAADLAAPLFDQVAGRWQAPTMFALPARELCHALRRVLEDRELPSVVVTGDTPYNARAEAFDSTVSNRAALIQVAVVSEGVDLPIRRLIDLSPTLSPVKWLQQLGRITRPSKDVEPLYVCTNRNLLRHGYLLEGCLPAEVMRDSQAAFPKMSPRSGLRVVGLEALGRLKPVELPLLGGMKALAYSMAAMENHKRTDYFVFVHPLREEPLWAKRESVYAEGESVTYGKWHRTQPPSDVAGFASLPPSPLSEKQAAWWARDAQRYGLDPAATVTKKQFPALPVLCDMRARLT